MRLIPAEIMIPQINTKHAEAPERAIKSTYRLKLSGPVKNPFPNKLFYIPSRNFYML